MVSRPELLLYVCLCSHMRFLMGACKTLEEIAWHDYAVPALAMIALDITVGRCDVRLAGWSVLPWFALLKLLFCAVGKVK